MTLLTDGLDPSGEATQVAAVQRAMLSAVGTFTGRPLPEIEHMTLYGVPSDDPMAPFAPAVLAFLAYFFVYILTGISFLRERVGGTLERLMATPITRGEVVLGYTLGFGLFAAIQVGLLLLWSLGTVRGARRSARCPRSRSASGSPTPAARSSPTSSSSSPPSAR